MCYHEEPLTKWNKYQVFYKKNGIERTHLSYKRHLYLFTDTSTLWEERIELDRDTHVIKYKFKFLSQDEMSYNLLPHASHEYLIKTHMVENSQNIIAAWVTKKHKHQPTMSSLLIKVMNIDTWRGLNKQTGIWTSAFYRIWTQGVD